MNSMKAQSHKETTNLIYNKYWDLATGYLKLSVMNELIQMFRTNEKILDPLLKTMLILGKRLDKDTLNDPKDDLGKDLAHLLFKLVARLELSDDHPEFESVIRSSLLSLV